MAKSKMTKEWEAEANKLLKGRTIKSVRYMTDAEANDMGWGARPVVLLLDNGTMWYPSRDDEGNDAGALFGENKGEGVTLPVLRREDQRSTPHGLRAYRPA